MAHLTHCIEDLVLVSAYTDEHQQVTRKIMRCPTCGEHFTIEDRDPVSEWTI